MNISFTKMHGIGNDFVILDAAALSGELSSAQARWLADRQRGVGCDQVLVVHSDAEPFRVDIFNANGSRAEQCGNGMRCVATWLQAKGKLSQTRTRLSTSAGELPVEIHDDGDVSVTFGAPRKVEQQVLAVAGQNMETICVNLGNPHAVLVIDDLTTLDLAHLGPAIAEHSAFPQGCNAGFMHIDSPEAIRLLVWERGVGPTAACGSGACAAVIAGYHLGLLDQSVKVVQAGGRLTVQCSGPDHPVILRGPATFVYEGSINQLTEAN